MKTCRIEGCGGKHLARGFCRSHYKKWSETEGRPGAHPCEFPSCPKKASAKGRCHLHYQQLYRRRDYVRTRRNASRRAWLARPEVKERRARECRRWYERKGRAQFQEKYQKGGKEAQREYLALPTTKALRRAWYAKRRALKLRATPAWANEEKIKKIYAECPKGHHVDHIVPLQGRKVCGLHVEDNLQYLPAAENIRKSNKHEAD